jgi:hypothetical protein
MRSKKPPGVSPLGEVTVELDPTGMMPVIKRTKRAQSQLAGVLRLIEEGRDCEDLSGGASPAGLWASFSRLTAMRFWMRPRSAVRYALWLGGLLVLLGGLFGMHGLDNHGDAGMDTIAHATIAGPAEHRAAAEHESIAGTVARSAAVTLAVTGESGHSGMGMGAPGMCVAVLVIALMALLLRRHAGHRLRPMLCLASRPGRAPRGRGRDPDPPSLIRLSIQRC